MIENDVGYFCGLNFIHEKTFPDSIFSCLCNYICAETDNEAGYYETKDDDNDHIEYHFEDSE
jgi:hypothetical protein